MATSKYVSASLELPLARWDFAEETRDEMGVSEWMSEGERQYERGAAAVMMRRRAPRARNDSRIIIVSESVDLHNE